MIAEIKIKRLQLNGGLRSRTFANIFLHYIYICIYIYIYVCIYTHVYEGVLISS